MKLKARTRKRPAKPAYHSPLREEQKQLTVAKIREGVYRAFLDCGEAESITYKAVAKLAGVTEMTVFRYFPQREELLKALWERINQELGPEVSMPTSASALLERNRALHLGFSSREKLVHACITSAQGREMRASLNAERRKAFLAIASELDPSLDGKSARKAAAILQLLHSASAWDSLRTGWEMSGEEIAETTQLALEAFVQHIKKGRSK